MGNFESLDNNNNPSISDVESLSREPSYEEHMASRGKKASFEYLRHSDNLPEGIRDEQDYQEYLEKQEAKQNEEMLKIKERLDEKTEILGSFEKRIDCNKDFYNELAEEAAFLWNLMPDIKYYAYGNHISLGGPTKKIRDEYGKYQLDVRHAWVGASPEESRKYHFELNLAYTFRDAQRMMSTLRNGVESENPTPDFVLDKDSLPKPFEDFRKNLKEFARENPEKDLSKMKFSIGTMGSAMRLEDLETLDNLYGKTENLIVPAREQKEFGDCLKGFFISKKEYGEKLKDYFAQEQIDEAREKAKEMMSANKWDDRLDGIILQSEKHYGGKHLEIDEIKDAEKALSDLEFAVGDGTFYTGPGYSDSNTAPDFVPRMESVYSLWGKINEIEDLIQDSYQYFANRHQYRNGTSNTMRRISSQK